MPFLPGPAIYPPVPTTYPAPSCLKTRRSADQNYTILLGKMGYYDSERVGVRGRRNGDSGAVRLNSLGRLPANDLVRFEMTDETK